MTLLQNHFNSTADETEKVLRDLGIIKFERRADGTFLVPGNINLSNQDLTKLPDLSRVEVGRGFYCEHNQLTSLAGAPASVGRHFHCKNNHLTSLRGAPASVGRYFHCKSNQLTSLENAPMAFKRLQSDFGVHESWCDVPEELKVSPETREHMAQDINRAIEKRVLTAATAKADIKTLKPPKFRPKPKPKPKGGPS